MRDEQDGLVAAAELGKLVEALRGERLVANGEHFVDEKNVRIDVDRDRESEPHVHAGRVGLDRRVDEILEFGEVHDLVEALGDLALRQAQHDPVDEDVLTTGDLGMKPGAQFDERGNPAVDLDRAFVGPRDAGDALEQRRLPGSVLADDAVGAAFRHGERHAAQGRERFVGLQVANQAALQQGRLQGRKLLLPRVAPVDLREVGDVNRGVHQTSSANESRRRSNTK